MDDPEFCEQGDSVEDDRLVSRCLDKLGVRLIDTRDVLKRHRFMIVPADRALAPASIANPDGFWVHHRTVFPIEQVI